MNIGRFKFGFLTCLKWKRSMNKIFVSYFCTIDGKTAFGHCVVWSRKKRLDEKGIYEIETYLKKSLNADKEPTILSFYRLGDRTNG